MSQMLYCLWMRFRRHWHWSAKQSMSFLPTNVADITFLCFLWLFEGLPDFVGFVSYARPCLFDRLGLRGDQMVSAGEYGACEARRRPEASPAARSIVSITRTCASLGLPSVVAARVALYFRVEV